MAVLLEPNRIGSLTAAVEKALGEYLKHAGGASREDRVKDTQILLKELHRVLSYTSSKTSHRDALNACQRPFRNLIENALALCPKSPEKRRASGLYKAAETLQRALAHRI
jgi:hypothetical protein